MNTLNASSASVISHWNLQKQLLLVKIDKKRRLKSGESAGVNIFENVRKTGFFDNFSANMERSVDKYRAFIRTIIKE